MAELKVYGAPWCPDCRRSKQFLNELRVPYDWIDIGTYPEQAEVVRQLNDGKQIIPTIVFADGSFLAEPSDEQLAAKLGLQRKAERSAYDLVIIGGGPAALTASIYAAREGISCLVLDRSGLGGQAAKTERIDNYPGFPDGIGGGELVDRMIRQAKRYGVETLTAVSARNVRREGSSILVTTDHAEYCADAVLLATGTTYRRLGVRGEDQLIGAGIHFCATCDGPFYKGADELMVIGGGNSGLEEGLFLSQFANKIRVIQVLPELTASKLLQDKVRNSPKFEIHTNTEVTAFLGNGKLAGVATRDRSTGEQATYHPAAAFLFIGLDPNTSFLKGSVELDQWGFIVTDDMLQTSVPGVFAAGDVRAGSTKQLAAATGEGVTALLMIRQYLQRRSLLAKHEVNA